jgi:long-subunit fatty acid transport protein
MTKKPITYCLVIFVINLSAFDVFAGGFENNVIGIKGSAMGFAITGIADDASAVYYNPGGLILTNEESWQGEIYTWFSYDEQNFRNNSVRR